MDPNPNRRRTKRKSGITHYRSVASIKRAKTAFFTLCQANLSRKGTPLFITLTFIEETNLNLAYECLRQFFQNVKKYSGETCAHLTVPEWQKNGNIHFHSLVWNYPHEKAKQERKCRFLQRCWARGFVDVRIARDNSPKIAGYLAKYMSKTYADPRLNNRRAFSHSNNIEKRYTYGSNTLTDYLPYLIPSESDVAGVVEYDTMYLGKCTKTTYKVK